MSTDQLKCPKCDGTMEEGYCLDHSVGGGGQQRWCEGKPERSVSSGGRHLMVTTYRCCECGFLEAYAGKRTPETISREAA